MSDHCHRAAHLDERWTWLMEENFRETKAELLAWINRHAVPEDDEPPTGLHDSMCRDQGDETDS